MKKIQFTTDLPKQDGIYIQRYRGNGEYMYELILALRDREDSKRWLISDYPYLHVTENFIKGKTSRSVLPVG